jgi:hypothetical protein
VEGLPTQTVTIQCNDPACYIHVDDGNGGMIPYHPSNMGVNGGMSYAQSQTYQRAHSHSVPIFHTVPTGPVFATPASVRTQTSTNQEPRGGGRGRGRPPIVG